MKPLRSPLECPGCHRVVTVFEVCGRVLRVGCHPCRRTWLYRPCDNCGRPFVSEVTGAGRPPQACARCRELDEVLVHQVGGR